MARLQRITGEVYILDKYILPLNPELKHHTLVQHAPDQISDVLYEVRTEAMVLHYTIREGEEIQYFDVMSLYPYVCKYSMFPVGHHKIHAGNASRDKLAILSKVGLIKCTVLPPKRLCYTTLPFRCNNKFYSVNAGCAPSNAIF